MSPRKDLLVYDVPPEIRDALVADAYQQNVSINEAAVSILAAHYKVKHIPTGVPFTADSGGKNLSIRGGAKLHRQIDIDRARRGGGTLRGIVLERLALHYGLEAPPIGRRPRGTSSEGGSNV
jgi:hypothetical protein